jgi:WD40 repeat protein
VDIAESIAGPPSHGYDCGAMRELDLYSDADSEKKPLSTGARRELDLYADVTPVMPVPVREAESTGRTMPASRGDVRPEDWISDLWRGFSPAVRERFEPRQLIGEGGMGVVIEAHDNVMNRVVAIKGPRDPRHMSATSRERQLKEAQIAARLTHSNILPVYDLWTDTRGNSWCSMLRVPGDAPTLGTRLTRLEGTPIEKRPLACLLRTFLEICRGVHYAHDQGFLHRDIKPENVFLAEAEESLALVADWGVAIEKDAAKTSDVDRVGTRGYAAPEQLGLLGDTRCDERSDVYSLGILLYEMVVGRRFVRGSSVASSASSVPDEAPPPPPIPDLVPRELAAIIQRATSWSPAERHPDVCALQNEVETYSNDGMLEGLEYGTRERLAKWSRAHPWAAGVAAMGLAAGVVLAAFSYMLWHKSVWLRKRLAIIHSERSFTARAARDTDVANHYAALALSTWPAAYLMPATAPYSSLAESGLRGRHMWTRALEAPSSCVAIAPDRRRIAVAGKDGLVEIWDAKTAKRLLKLDGHTRTVRALAFSASGLLASAGDDGQVRVWEKDGRARPPLIGHKGRVHSLAFSPDGNVITTASDDGMLRTWRLDIATPRLMPIKLKTQGAGSIALDAARSKLFVAAQDGSMPMVDLLTRAQVGNITPCHGGLRLITYIPAPGGESPRRLVGFSGTEPDTSTVVRLWDLTFWREWGALHHERPVTAVALSPDLMSLVSGSEDGVVRVWDIDSRKVQLELSGHQKSVSAMAIATDARLLASTGEDGTLRVWDIETGPQRTGIPKQLRGTSHYVWTGDAQHVLELPRSGGEATAWSARGRKKIAAVPLGSLADFETPPVVSPDGTRLAGLAGRRVIVYEMKKGSPPRLELVGKHQLPTKARAIAFTGGNRLLAGTATKTSLVVYDVADGRTITEVYWPRDKRRERVEPPVVVLGHDAERLAAIDADGAAWAWVPRTQGRDPVHVDIFERVSAVAWTPRGDTLAVGGESGEITLWRHGQTRFVHLDGHRARVESLAFSSDCRQLISTSASAVARIWDLWAWEDPAAVLRRLARTSPYELDADALHPKQTFTDEPWLPPDYEFPEVGR